MRRDCSPRTAAVATYEPAVPVNGPFLRRIFGFRDGIDGRSDGPISAMIGQWNLDGDMNPLAAQARLSA